MPVLDSTLMTLPRLRGVAVVALATLAALGHFLGDVRPARSADPPPRPLLAKDQAVDWWFVFKLTHRARLRVAVLPPKHAHACSAAMY